MPDGRGDTALAVKSRGRAKARTRDDRYPSQFRSENRRGWRFWMNGYSTLGRTNHMPCKLQVLLADITTLAVDAIVNAASPTLLGGAGVDGAIHSAAGPELYWECRALQGCPVGEARITQGYKLRAKHVIHAVGPRWHGGAQGEGEQLAAAYRASLELAEQHGVRSIAFPCISTGAYGFPSEQAAEIALRTVSEFTASDTQLQEVWFCCYTHRDEELYRRLLSLSSAA